MFTLLTSSALSKEFEGVCIRTQHCLSVENMPKLDNAESIATVVYEHKKKGLGMFAGAGFNQSRRNYKLLFGVRVRF